MRLVIFVLFAVCFQIHAGILTKELGTKEIAGVKIASKSVVSYKSQVFNLESFSAGLRTKKVVLLNVNVYVGEIYKTPGVSIDKSSDKVVASFLQQPVAAIQLTFLRDVDADKVMNSFKEALEKNKADLNSPGIKTLLEKVAKGGEVQKGQTLTFVIQKNGDKDHSLVFENNKGESVEIAGSENIKSILLMWFGEPADSGIQKLKEELLK